MLRVSRRLVAAAGMAALSLVLAPTLRAEITAEQVLNSIEGGKKFLLEAQNPSNGSWVDSGNGHPVGATSLVLLALINSGMSPQEKAIARGLDYLRKAKEPTQTYDASLLIMVLAAAKEGGTDDARIASLVKQLEQSQSSRGPNSGGWSYHHNSRGESDNSNSQFALLGLREAQYAGIPVSRHVWELARTYWTQRQNNDGGWNYKTRGDSSYNSMTAAGVSSLVIAESMLPEGKDENPDGTPICCGQESDDNAVERGIAWFGREGDYRIDRNLDGPRWPHYSLYGLERVGRLSGRRFFGNHDWYREGAELLLDRQDPRLGSWKGRNENPVIGTSMALLFLSKGLAPVLINKLKYGPARLIRENAPGRKPARVPAQAAPNAQRGAPRAKHAREKWNLHPRDTRNLTEMITRLPRWPKLLVTQEVDIDVAIARGGVEDLLQAPVLFINGAEDPSFEPQHVELLRQYVDQGGFIFAEAACQKTGFEAGFRKLIEDMYPQGEHRLERLPSDHPVYQSEYLIDAESTELSGVDIGCRTGIIFSGHDFACLWDKWSVVDPPGRSLPLKEAIVKANRVGVNVIAYASGRQPPNKLAAQHRREPTDVPDEQKPPVASRDQQIERGFLQIAKLRHGGDWNAAPSALHNLLVALKARGGVAASTEERDLPLADPQLAKFPMVYMHGRNPFRFPAEERERLREYLDRGGVLFADACCSLAPFDRSFRELMEQIYPDQKLKRIPPEHALFTKATGHNLERIKRREPATAPLEKGANAQVVDEEPFLEGIEIDGRFVVIYSKYDISCALERQTSAGCAVYSHEDATKIATNVVLYAMLQ